MGYRLSGDQAETRAVGFDYGSIGRGGWDEAPSSVVPRRKRAAKKRLAWNPDSYLARAKVQGRQPLEVLNLSVRCTEQVAGVYVIVNVVTEDVYVGCAARILERWKGHAASMRTRKHQVPKINALVRKHGLSSFRFYVLCRYEDDEASGLLERERLWTDFLRPTLNKSVFNKFGVPRWEHSFVVRRPPLHGVVRRRPCERVLRS